MFGIRNSQELKMIHPFYRHTIIPQCTEEPTLPKETMMQRMYIPLKRDLIVIAVPVIAILLSVLAYGQTPGTFTDRPTTQSSPGTPYLNPANAYDNNFSTAATASVTEGVKGAKSDIEVWSGFSSAPGGANTIKLNVNSSASCNANGIVTVSYSLNGGVSFTTIYMIENATRGQQTDSVTLSNSQDLTQVEVKAEVTALNVGSGTAGTASNAIYEIWISGND
jgi:hypothetical protein